MRIHADPDPKPCPGVKAIDSVSKSKGLLLLGKSCTYSRCTVLNCLDMIVKQVSSVGVWQSGGSFDTGRKQPCRALAVLKL
jgi:hypothetical protein